MTDHVLGAFELFLKTLQLFRCVDGSYAFLFVADRMMRHLAAGTLAVQTAQVAAQLLCGRLVVAEGNCFTGFGWRKRGVCLRV